MRFDSPALLWLLLVAPPALWFLLWRAWRRKQALLGAFIEPRLLASLTAGLSARRRQVRWALLVGAVAALVVALARPQWGFAWEETRQRGLDLVIAIDTSKSMLADDLAPNRLTRARLAALDLMKLAHNDRLGLVAFAGGAFLQCPLTSDDDAFKQCVDALNVDIIPQGGTAIAEAIATARASFRDDPDAYKILVLFTDGEDHDENALDAARAAAEAGLRIFTVGVGTPEGELLRTKDNRGRTEYIRDDAGNPVKSRLNEKLLQDIAAAAGGFYLPLRGANTMDALYERGLAPLPKAEASARLVKRWFERYYWPLLAALLLLIAETLLPERRRARSRATRASPKVLRAAPASIVTLACLLTMPATLPASTGKARRAYDAGRFDESLQEYQRLLQRQPDDPRLKFNAGAAAYRDGQFEEAARLFDEALSARDLELQRSAYYNRGHALYRLGERQDEPPQRLQTWEKSLRDFEVAMKLEPKDEDAKFNYEFVKQRLEELKQEQQQQQQNQKQDDQKQDPQDQPQQPQQNQQDQQQQGEQQQKQDQQQSGQDQQQQPQAKPDQQKDPQSQPDQASPQQKPDAKQAREDQAQAADQQPQDQQQASAQGVMRMTPQEARQLLDAQRAHEAVLPYGPPQKPEDRARKFRDW